jgi:hypothetical protein
MKKRRIITNESAKKTIRNGCACSGTSSKYCSAEVARRRRCRGAGGCAGGFRAARRGVRQMGQLSSPSSSQRRTQGSRWNGPAQPQENSMRVGAGVPSIQIIQSSGAVAILKGGGARALDIFHLDPKHTGDIMALSEILLSELQELHVNPIRRIELHTERESQEAILRRIRHIRIVL